MRKILFGFLFLLGTQYTSQAIQSDKLVFGTFGSMSVFRPDGNPNSVVLFVSGDGGWDKSAIDIVNSIVKLGALVVGIDINTYCNRIKYYKSKCFYPAADFEQLSLLVQKKYKVPVYMKPILVGYSAGASLVYGILAQSPDNTFRGAISLGFCPEIEISKPLCRGKALKQHVIKEGHVYCLDASDKLSAPFIVLHGLKIRSVLTRKLKKFMQGIPWAELITLPNQGHSFSNEQSWFPQFVESFKKVMNSPTYVQQKLDQNELLKLQKLIPLPGNLPLTIVPSEKNDSLPMVFFISGDGGWTSFDQSLSESLAKKGMPIVGLDAQQFFLDFKTPEESASEISKAVEHYMVQWRKSSFVLIGYSFGASIVPFIANRIPSALKPSLKGTFLLSPDAKCDFEIHVTDMLSMENSLDTFDVLKELQRVKQTKSICVFGVEEGPDMVGGFKSNGINVLFLPGSHHYNDDFNAIAELIKNNIL